MVTGKPPVVAPAQVYAITGSRAWVDGFRLQCEDAEDALMDTAQRFTADESFEAFDS